MKSDISNGETNGTIAALTQAVAAMEGRDHPELRAAGFSPMGAGKQQILEFDLFRQYGTVSSRLGNVLINPASMALGIPTFSRSRRESAGPKAYGIATQLSQISSEDIPQVDKNYQYVTVEDSGLSWLADNFTPVEEAPKDIRPGANIPLVLIQDKSTGKITIGCLSKVSTTKEGSYNVEIFRADTSEDSFILTARKLLLKALSQATIDDYPEIIRLLGLDSLDKTKVDYGTGEEIGHKVRGFRSQSETISPGGQISMYMFLHTAEALIQKHD